MEILSVKNLKFKYDNGSNNVLNMINLSVSEGDFTLVCGASGCGKTTLLRLIKKSLSPFGEMSGDLRLSIDDDKIGYVFQNPESQIVMDNVFDELIFGCENLGMSTELIRLRLSEITAFFGIEDLLGQKCCTLSGGQMQLINLASIMMMEPELIIFDEPLSQLDPISAASFLSILDRLHQELGITIIICEHNLNDILTRTTDILYLKDGASFYFSNPQAFADYIISHNDNFVYSLPSVTRLAIDAINNNIIDFKDYPLTVRNFRQLLNVSGKASVKNELSTLFTHPRTSQYTYDTSAVRLKNVCFRYSKNTPDVIDNLNLDIHKGDFYAIIGGNGAGKSSLLSLLTGYRKPYYGRININGKAAYIPQNPAMAFVEDELLKDLRLLCKNNKIPENTIYEICSKYPIFSEIPDYMSFNPLDLSGGQLQLTALFKAILLTPDILLLDEPSKGLDGCHKKQLSDLFKSLISDGTTIVMVSHDLTFVSENAVHCGMMFMGRLAASGETEAILKENHFYTTPVYRVMR